MTKEERLKAMYEHTEALLTDESLTDEDVFDFDRIQDTLTGIAQVWEVKL